tara:strand:+ start:976 stop:1242 length:267 start_codon:yes stop_codon:yes gene_type:complete
MNDNYLAIPSHRREYMKEYFQRNKAKCKLSQLKWREKNREYVKEYMREYMKTYRKVPCPYKGRKGLVKLEKKKDIPLKFTYKNITLTF